MYECVREREREFDDPPFGYALILNNAQAIRFNGIKYI